MLMDYATFVKHILMEYNFRKYNFFKLCKFFLVRQALCFCHHILIKGNRKLVYLFVYYSYEFLFHHPLYLLQFQQRFYRRQTVDINSFQYLTNVFKGL